MTAEYVAPECTKEAFHCPFCGTYAHQVWQPMGWMYGSDFEVLPNLKRALCWRCKEYSLWLGVQMIYPDRTGVAAPNPDLDKDIQDDYREAASIVNKSPRGAAALLRLCIQKLCKQLGEKGENPNDDTASLVRQGLPIQIQQSLDIVRVIGNHAVHPGQIDIKDNRDTAFTLFALVNLIADDRISEPKRIAELYGSLPEKDRKNIEKRDKPKK